MAKKKLLLGMLVMVIVLAFSGCETAEDEPPASLVATLLTNGNIHLTWSTSSGVDSYEIVFRTNLDSPDTRRDAGTSRITTFTHLRSSFSFTDDVDRLFYSVRGHGTRTSSDGQVTNWSTAWSNPAEVYIR
jgi:hypothetical protein